MDIYTIDMKLPYSAQQCLDLKQIPQAMPRTQCCFSVRHTIGACTLCHCTPFTKQNDQTLYNPLVTKLLPGGFKADDPQI